MTKNAPTPDRSNTRRASRLSSDRRFVMASRATTLIVVGLLFNVAEAGQDAGSAPSPQEISGAPRVVRLPGIYSRWRTPDDAALPTISMEGLVSCMVTDQALRDRVEGLRRSTQAFTNDDAALSKEVETMNLRSKDLEAEIARLEARQGALSLRAGVQAQRKADLEKTRPPQNASQAQVAAYNSKVKGFNDDLQAHRAVAVDYDRDAQRLNESISRFKEDASQLSTTLEGHKDRSAALGNSITAFNTEVATLRTGCGGKRELTR